LDNTHEDPALSIPTAKSSRPVDIPLDFTSWDEGLTKSDPVETPDIDISPLLFMASAGGPAQGYPHPQGNCGAAAHNSCLPQQPSIFQHQGSGFLLNKGMCGHANGRSSSGFLQVPNAPPIGHHNNVRSPALQPSYNSWGVPQQPQTSNDNIAISASLTADTLAPSSRNANLAHAQSKPFPDRMVPTGKMMMDHMGFPGVHDMSMATMFMPQYQQYSHHQPYLHQPSCERSQSSCISDTAVVPEVNLGAQPTHSSGSEGRSMPQHQHPGLPHCGSIPRSSTPFQAAAAANVSATVGVKRKASSAALASPALQPSCSGQTGMQLVPSASMGSLQHAYSALPTPTGPSPLGHASASRFKQEPGVGAPEDQQQPAQQPGAASKAATTAGTETVRTRAEALERYRQKKANRMYTKKIRWEQQAMVLSFVFIAPFMTYISDAKH
jgi:hypothetical protein